MREEKKIGISNSDRAHVLVQAMPYIKKWAGETIVEVPDMPAVAANSIAALYGDMEATYLVVDRVGIRVLRDPYTNKPFVHFYTTKRVGGGVYNPEPMRALKVAAAG